MAFQNPSDEVICMWLAQPRRIAVVGCSPNPTRDSHRIARLLMARGHEVFPVNPNGREILGRRCYESVLAVPAPVDIVDVFRRSEHVGEVAGEAIRCRASVLWLQLGVVDEEAAMRASSAGLTVVMDRCPAIEYRRLFPV